jgi:hypothetical protein
MRAVVIVVAMVVLLVLVFTTCFLRPSIRVHCLLDRTRRRRTRQSALTALAYRAPARHVPVAGRLER